MKPRRTLFLLASAAVCGLALLVSCTFPDVSFSPAGGEGGGGSEGGEGGSDESSTDSSAAADATSDTALIEAATRTDASTKVDASGCVTCDCDTDGFYERDGGCEGGPGTVFDCDDTDNFIKPGQTFVDDFRWKSVHAIPYDWNCSGNVEKAYPSNLKCGGNVVTGCTGGQGFTGDPPCGTAGDYFDCRLMGAVCTAVKIDIRNQICK